MADVAQSAMAPLKRAPATALTANSRCAGTRSASVNSVLVNAPTTKPICTLMVSQDCCPDVSDHSWVSWGTTADAENQSDMASNSASANSQRVRHLWAVDRNGWRVTGDGQGRTLLVSGIRIWILTDISTRSTW